MRPFGSIAGIVISILQLWFSKFGEYSIIPYTLLYTEYNERAFFAYAKDIRFFLLRDDGSKSVENKKRVSS
jgi:hypothetical protein